jgi:fatty acid desaturase
MLKRLQRFKVQGEERWDPYLDSIGKSRYGSEDDRRLILDDPVLKTAKLCVIDSGQQSCGITPEAITFYTIITFLTIAAAYMALVRQSASAAIIWPILAWILSIGIAHDAGHNAVSRKLPWLNGLLSYTSLPLLFEPRSWALQHMRYHHLYTNDLVMDVDTKYGSFTGMARHHPSQAHSKIMRFTWPVFIMMQLIVASFDLVVKFPLTGQFGAFGWLGPLCWFGVVCLPWFRETATVTSFSAKLLLSLAPAALTSTIFVIVSQSSHLGEATIQVSQGQQGILAPGQWGRCQALSAVNYRPESAFWMIATGGLNLQSVHHLLPFVYCWRLRKIWPILRERLLQEHGIILPEMPTLWDAYLAFVFQLQRSCTSDVSDQSKAISVAGDKRL